MRLGKHPPKIDHRTIMMSSIIHDILPDAPPAVDNEAHLAEVIGMYSNDQISDCTAAAAAYMIETWTSDVSVLAAPDIQDVLDFYSEISGWDPADPSTDRGAVMLEALSRWRSVGIGGHQIGAYVKINHLDVEHVKSAIYLFGTVYVGAMLPLAAQHDGAWIGPEGNPTGEFHPGSWGGHAMACGSFDRSGVRLRTWGRRQQADWVWWQTYVDEAYACISRDWLNGSGESPAGVDIAGLSAMLKEISDGSV